MNKHQLEDWLTNCKRARANIEAAPENIMDLSDYVQKNYNDDNSCGTLFCAIGLQTKDPYFVRRGIEYKRMNILGSVSYHFRCRNPFYTTRSGVLYMEDLFGPRAYYALFATYGKGDFDNAILGGIQWEDDDEDRPIKTISDKALALARMDIYITDLEAKLKVAKAVFDATEA